MSEVPPAYAPSHDPSKMPYPPAMQPPYPQAQPLPPQPGGYYPQQGQPMPPTAPGYTATTYYPPPGAPQQQPQQFVVSQGAPVVVASQQPYQSFVCHIVLACFTFWCCGCLFGLIAFILALIAQSYASTSPSSARQLGVASIAVSVTGIILAVVLTIIIVVIVPLATGLTIMEHQSSMGCEFQADGECYKFKSSLFSSDQCDDLHSNSHYENGICYYNF